MCTEFTLDDKVIARSLLRDLPPKQRKALVLRFWHNYTLFEVAKALRITWSEADKIVKGALVQMKDECLSQPRFSRVLNHYHSAI
jgi:DNA-directed RNA polymerase specialized sigma24 family protein